VNVEVNGRVVSVKSGSTVLQACEAAGVEIPRFCYHERLLVAGNCRMCLVEIGGSPKPQASCAWPVSPNMKVFTDSPRVKKARESVMEFLLLNHPLDCPICDQGGECDRQDQSMVFGSDRSRMHELKRGVEDKDLGPLVKTVMTRCIHCTRCIRFASEIAGVADLGTSGRGRETEVGTYVSKPRRSEVSGNLIDLCPVGALTSKPYAFVARPWELESIDSIDTMDGLGASIRVQVRGTEVRRILPRENDDINQAWLGDKSRFSRDGNSIQRLNADYAVKLTGNGKILSMVDREVAMAKSVELLQDSQHVNFVVSPSLDIESLYRTSSLGELLRGRGQSVGLEVMGHSSPSHSVDSFDVRTSIKGVSSADRVVLVGLNPRHESPILNLLLRESFLRDRVHVVSRGQPLDLTYPVSHVGLTLDTLNQMIRGSHPRSKVLSEAKRPLIMVGPSISLRQDAEVVKALLHTLSTQRERNASVEAGWTVLQTLHAKSGSAAAGVMGRPGFSGWSNAKGTSVVRVNVTSGDIREAGYSLPSLNQRTSLISRTSHGDELVAMSDVVRSIPSDLQASGLYMNTEGRIQTAYRATVTPDSREFVDHRRSIVRMDLITSLGGSISRIPFPSWISTSVTGVTSLSKPLTQSSLSPSWQTMTVPGIHDYYTEGHVLARMSPTMAKASSELQSRGTFRS